MLIQALFLIAHVHILVVFMVDEPIRKTSTCNFILKIANFFVQFRPLEQLMGVFPAASKKHLPVTWQRLMCDPVSLGRRVFQPLLDCCSKDH